MVCNSPLGLGQDVAALTHAIDDLVRHLRCLAHFVKPVYQALFFIKKLPLLDSHPPKFFTFFVVSHSPILSRRDQLTVGQMFGQDDRIAQLKRSTHMPQRKGPGRPAKYKRPERIDAAPEEIAKVVL